MVTLTSPRMPWAQSLRMDLPISSPGTLMASPTRKPGQANEGIGVEVARPADGDAAQLVLLGLVACSLLPGPVARPASKPPSTTSKQHTLTNKLRTIIITKI